MGLNGIYRMMKEIRQKMYQENKKNVTISQEDFFAIYRMICLMMQIKQITDAQEDYI